MYQVYGTRHAENLKTLGLLRHLSDPSKIVDCLTIDHSTIYPGPDTFKEQWEKETEDGRASSINCKSHFHTWLGSESEPCMWLDICKNMINSSTTDCVQYDK